MSGGSKRMDDQARTDMVMEEGGGRGAYWRVVGESVAGRMRILGRRGRMGAEDMEGEGSFRSGVTIACFTWMDRSQCIAASYGLV
jgi:hypothetical protein